MDGSSMTLRNLADRQYRRVIRQRLSEEAADCKIETTPDPAPAPAPAPRVNNARKFAIVHPIPTRSPSPELEIVFEKICVTPAKARQTSKSEQSQRSPFPLQGRAGRKRCRCGFLPPKLNSPLSSSPSPFIPQPQEYPDPNIYPAPMMIVQAIVSSSTTTEEEDVARMKKELEAGAMDLTVSHAADEDVDKNESLIETDNKGPDSHDDGSYELQIQPSQSPQLLVKPGPPSHPQPKHQPNYVDYNRNPSPVSGEVFTVEIGAAVDLCSDQGQGLLEAAAGSGTGTNNINNPTQMNLSRLQDFGLGSDLFALEEDPMDTNWNPPFTPPHDLDEHNMAGTGTGTDTAPCHMEITGTGSAGCNGQGSCDPNFNVEALPPLSFLDELEI